MTVTAPPLVAGDTIRKATPTIALIIGVVLLQVMFAGAGRFPAALDTFFSDPINRWAAWARAARRSHPIFTQFFGPISDALRGGLDGVEAALNAVPWFVLPLAVVAIVWRLRDWKMTLLAGLAMLYPAVVGLWGVTIETLALMTISVFLSVAIGVPLGVWAAFNRHFEQMIRPLLDAMQTVPAPVYFIPMLVLFGVGPVSAAAATIIYALPPAVRLTTLGIRQVPPAMIEAGEMFGSTRRQMLFKIQLPAALPTVMAGVNQALMMGLGIVVLATLLAAGGLGQTVMDTLSKRRPGRGFAAGLAIVAIAVVLDRVGRAIIDRTHRLSRRFVRLTLIGLVALTVIGWTAGWSAPPAMLTINVFDPLDGIVTWARDNLSFITIPLADFIVGAVIVPVRLFLIGTVAWPVLVFITGFMAWRLKGLRLAVFSAAALVMVGLVGMWELSLDTLTQVMAAVILAIAVAVPIGIWMGRSHRVEAALSPVLDALQTIPALVYIIPAVTLFSLGPVPGIIASVLYASVPGIRITALGIRGVPEESIEASRTFGATPRQTMLGVRIPLAAPTIMAGINQVIMMVLAMVIIAGLVGGGALGFETIRAVTRSESGLGFEVALAIVVIAVILDRLTQAGSEKLQPPSV